MLSVPLASLPLAWSFVFARVVAPYGGYSLMHLVITLIVVGAAVGILLVVLRQSGVAVPQWVVTILGILAVAVVAVLAIRFLMTL
jgi:hypothetical protein